MLAMGKITQLRGHILRTAMRHLEQGKGYTSAIAIRQKDPWAEAIAIRGAARWIWTLNWD